MSDENSEADFDRWCFTATDDRYLIHGRPIPMLTTLLHRVCNGDAEKFEEALHIMRFAFDAGKLALNGEIGQCAKFDKLVMAFGACPSFQKA